MSAIVSLPPKLLDHTFPRDVHELVDVSEALGAVVYMARRAEVLILSTEALRLIVEEFDWNGPASVPKREIHRLLSQLFLSGQGMIVETDGCAAFRSADRHPLPAGIDDNGGSVTLWAEEMAAALKWHDEYTIEDEFYIGIACAQAFCGRDLGQYPGHHANRRFPLVGPSEIIGSAAILRSAYVYDLPREDPPAVSVEQATKHLHLLGAREIIQPTRGSHYRVTFDGNRPWVLDPNNDPIPPRFLRQLKALTGYDYPLLCHVLARGAFPPRRMFFETS